MPAELPPGAHPALRDAVARYVERGFTLRSGTASRATLDGPHVWWHFPLALLAAVSSGGGGGDDLRSEAQLVVDEAGNVWRVRGYFWGLMRWRRPA